MFFEMAVRFCLRWEGGYVNHPADPGGATNFGITLNTLRGLPDPDLDGDGDVDADDVRALTVEQARVFYRERVWNALGLDGLPGPVGVAVFDAAVNCGARRAVVWLQQVCNAAGEDLACDGLAGPRTREAVRRVCDGRCGAEMLAVAHVLKRMAYYNRLAGDSRFRQFHLGWTNRAVELAGLVLSDT
jgi:lysozyme family protein